MISTLLSEKPLSFLDCRHFHVTLKQNVGRYGLCSAALLFSCVGWLKAAIVDVQVNLPQNDKCVLGYGHLPLVVSWPTGSTYKQMCDIYVA